MKRRLIVMRHAKSSWDNDVQTDHERLLDQRGRRDAPAIARRLFELDWLPKLVISSDAQRTRETFELIRLTLSEIAPATTLDVVFTGALYLAGMPDIRVQLSQVDDEVDSVLVLGHNPGWEAAVSWLSGASIAMTTANAALLEGAGDRWSDAIASPDSWQLLEVLRPKENLGNTLAACHNVLSRNGLRARPLGSLRGYFFSGTQYNGSHALACVCALHGHFPLEFDARDRQCHRAAQINRQPMIERQSTFACRPRYEKKTPLRRLCIINSPRVLPP